MMTSKAKQLIDSTVASKNGEHDDPPTTVFRDGTKRWLVNGHPHRDGGPAIVRANGTKLWYQHGQLHNDGGPAVELSDGSKEWYQRGQLHRLGGPAVESPTGRKEWWVNNREFTEEEFYMYVDQDTGEVLVPPGKKLAYG